MGHTVLVWRCKVLGYNDAGAVGLRGKCPCCQTDLLYHYKDYHDVVVEEEDCPLCGWYSHVGFEDEWGDYDCALAILKEYDVNSPELPLRELGAHLKRRSSDIYALDWLRFERLVADVFKEHGFLAVPTPPIKDKGADIVLLSHDKTGVQAIIECKKFSRHRRVGVSLVRQLVGAAVDWETEKAYLVTSSGFSSFARQLVVDYRMRGYEVDLVDATAFLKMLQVYNEKLPPLHRVTGNVREEIIRESKKILSVSERPKVSRIETIINKRSFSTWCQKYEQPAIYWLYSVTGQLFPDEQ